MYCRCTRPWYVYIGYTCADFNRPTHSYPAAAAVTEAAEATAAAVPGKSIALSVTRRAWENHHSVSDFPVVNRIAHRCRWSIVVYQISIDFNHLSSSLLFLFGSKIGFSRILDSLYGTF